MTRLAKAADIFPSVEELLAGVEIAACLSFTAHVSNLLKALTNTLSAKDRSGDITVVPAQVTMGFRASDSVLHAFLNFLFNFGYSYQIILAANLRFRSRYLAGHGLTSRCCYRL